MIVSKVNDVYANAYTKKGNPYHKTHTSRKILTGLAATVWATGVITSAVVLHKMPPNGKGVKEFLSLLGGLSIKEAPSCIKALVTSFLAGLGIDAIINKHRRNKADKAAEQLNTQA